jgi:DNA-binding transcriptional regulator YiaG
MPNSLHNLIRRIRELPMPNRNSVPVMSGEELSSLREKLELTQAGLADILGVTEKTIRDRESGVSPINWQAALAIIAVELASENRKAKARILELIARAEAACVAAP